MKRQKVLIVGPQFYGYNESVANAFKKLGFTVQVVGFADPTPPGLLNRFRIDLGQLAGVTRYLRQWEREFNQQLLKSYESFRPEIVLIIKGSKVLPRTITNMKSATRIIWFQDNVARCDRSRENMQVCDHVFVFEGSDVAKVLQENGIEAHFLPMGYDADIYHPIKDTVQDLDIFFVGFHYPERRIIFERLMRDFPRLRIQIFGRYVRYQEPSSWARFLSYKLRFPGCFYNGRLTPREINTKYAQAKISLNVHHRESNLGCNPRVFEISGAGSFQLVDSNPFVKEAFSNTLQMFADYDQLAELIDYYLAHDRKRKELAGAAVDIARLRHTFTHRVEEMLRVSGLDK